MTAFGATHNMGLAIPKVLLMKFFKPWQKIITPFLGNRPLEYIFFLHNYLGATIKFYVVQTSLIALPVISNL